MAKTKRSLGEKLRELRENYDLSQHQVAAALNIDRSTYTNYELDKTRPNLEMLVKLSHIFNVRKAFFLPDDDDDDEESKPAMDSFGSCEMVKSMSKEERGLLAIFRALPKSKRQALLDELKSLAAESEDQDD